MSSHVVQNSRLLIVWEVLLDDLRSAGELFEVTIYLAPPKWKLRERPIQTNKVVGQF